MSEIGIGSVGMTMDDVATIERIVRQGTFRADLPESKFGSWLDVDQDQALELIEMIPGRLPHGPLQGIRLHMCGFLECAVSVPDGAELCLFHERAKEALGGRR